jgi:hypothetical protein
MKLLSIRGLLSSARILSLLNQKSCQQVLATFGKNDTSDGNVFSLLGLYLHHQRILNR